VPGKGILSSGLTQWSLIDICTGEKSEEKYVFEMLINANLSYAYEYQASEILACILQMVLTLKDRF